jgi:alpha-L-fucosidase 2
MATQHDLIYEVAPRTWADGFPIGNGHFGAMIWQPEDPDRLVFGVTKLDVWDYRFREDPLVPFDRFKELLKTDPEQARRAIREEPGYDVPYPCPKPCGTLSLGIDEGFLPLNATLCRQSQRLRLVDATVECEYELSTKAVRVQGFVAPEANVLAIRVENTWVHDHFRQAHRQPIVLSREFDETLGLPQTGVHGGILFIRYVFPDGFTYVMAVAVSGVAVEPPVMLSHEVRTAALMPQMALGPVYTLYLTVATSKECNDPLQRAIDTLAQAEAGGFEEGHQQQRRWWSVFWDRSGVELQDRFLEALWYFSLYQLASTCRGSTAPGLFGLWNMTKSPAWHGDYHGDYNVSMAHWYLFSANHVELGEPYFTTFSKMLPRVKQQTWEHYQIDGAKYPIATAPDSGLDMTRNYYRMMQVSSAYYVIPFWWHYRYTLDEQFLRDTTFPILEEASKFYLALTATTPNGQLMIGPSWAPEQGPLPAYNVNNDLALIKVVWEAYREACRVLGRQPPYLPQVIECLEKYPDYPQHNGRFLDSATAPEDLLMEHTGLFAMVYPGGDIDADQPLAEVAARTIDTFHERAQRLSFVGRTSLSDVQAWTTQALGSARLRRAEQVDHYLMDVGLSEFLKPNGMFTIVSNGVFRTFGDKRAAYDFGDQPRAQWVIVAAGNTRHGRNRHFQFLEGPSAFLCIINEMLLQSHRGVLRVFPAVPARIAACSFQDLRGEGAFLISARCRHGRTERVEIHSLQGQVCTVRLFRYDSSDPVRLTGPQGALLAERIAPDTWRFPTQTDAWYVLTVGDNDEAVELQPSEEPSSVKSFIDCYGDVVYYGRSGRLE